MKATEFLKEVIALILGVAASIYSFQSILVMLVSEGHHAEAKKIDWLLALYPLIPLLIYGTVKSVFIKNHIKKYKTQQIVVLWSIVIGLILSFFIGSLSNVSSIWFKFIVLILIFLLCSLSLYQLFKLKIESRSHTIPNVFFFVVLIVIGFIFTFNFEMNLCSDKKEAMDKDYMHSRINEVDKALDFVDSLEIYIQKIEYSTSFDQILNYSPSLDSLFKRFDDDIEKYHELHETDTLQLENLSKLLKSISLLIDDKKSEHCSIHDQKMNNKECGSHTNQWVYQTYERFEILRYMEEKRLSKVLIVLFRDIQWLYAFVFTILLLNSLFMAWTKFERNSGSSEKERKGIHDSNQERVHLCMMVLIVFCVPMLKPIEEQSFKTQASLFGIGAGGNGGTNNYDYSVTYEADEATYNQNVTIENLDTALFITDTKVIEEELKKLNITLIELKDKVGYTDRTDDIIKAIDKVNTRIKNLEEELNQSKRR